MLFKNVGTPGIRLVGPEAGLDAGALIYDGNQGSDICALMPIRVVSVCVLCIAMTAPAIAQNPPDAFQTATASNLNTADSFVNLSNVGANGICVNTYALDPVPGVADMLLQLAFTEPAVLFFGRNDLNLCQGLSGPSSVTINLLASVPNGSTCDRWRAWRAGIGIERCTRDSAWSWWSSLPANANYRGADRPPRQFLRLHPNRSFGVWHL